MMTGGNMTKLRPTIRDSEVLARAKPELTDLLRCCECMEGAQDDDFTRALDIIAKDYEHDGYKLAKSLEESLYCIPCFADAEALEGVRFILEKHRSVAEREWVKSENLVIPYKVGDEITFGWGKGRLTGVVKKLHPETAILSVEVKGETGMPIVRLEDIKR
jgi:hypothetical protein